MDKILGLRHEAAQLLGFANYAEGVSCHQDGPRCRNRRVFT